MNHTLPGEAFATPTVPESAFFAADKRQTSAQAGFGNPESSEKGANSGTGKCPSALYALGRLAINRGAN